mgnify:CR=1 FL=1
MINIEIYSSVLINYMYWQKWGGKDLEAYIYFDQCFINIKAYSFLDLFNQIKITLRRFAIINCIKL